jgi:hypothetical protein
MLTPMPRAGMFELMVTQWPTTPDGFALVTMEVNGRPLADCVVSVEDPDCPHYILRRLEAAVRRLC